MKLLLEVKAQKEGTVMSQWKTATFKAHIAPFDSAFLERAKAGSPGWGFALLSLYL